MLELMFLASLSGIIGVLFRAALENETARFCFYHSIIIAFVIAIYFFFNPMLLYNSYGYSAVFLFFSLFGYAASDILNSIVFVIRNPYNPLKIFRKRRKR